MNIPRPTLRGWGLIAAAIVAFVLTQVFRRQELAYLAVFLLAVPAFSLCWVAFRRVGITVRRRFSPEAGVVNQAVVADVYLQNWGTFRTPAAVWFDQAEAPLQHARPAELPPLPAYTSTALDEPLAQRIRYPLDTRFRGAHEIGPLVVTVTDPFGCAVRRLRFGASETLLITPAVYELARIDLRLSTGDGAEQVSRRMVGAGEQDVIARKYLPGDSIRRVHWPATAKHGEMMVRQDDQRNDQDAVVVLDAASFPEGAALELGAPFEWAVSAVASIAAHLMAEGYGVRVVGHAATGQGDDEGMAFTAPFGGPRLMRELAVTAPGVLADPGDFRAAVDEAALTSPDAPPVFAVVAAGVGAADRIRSLAAMSSHPIALVVAPDDTRPVSARRRDPASAPASPRRETRASATAAELRHAGWTVLDCTPADALPDTWRALGEARGV